jgi:hypothetical protein
VFAAFRIKARVPNESRKHRSSNLYSFNASKNRKLETFQAGKIPEKISKKKNCGIEQKYKNTKKLKTLF